MNKKQSKLKNSANDNNEKIGVLVNHFLESDFAKELPPEELTELLQDLTESTSEEVMKRGLKTAFKLSKELAKSIFVISHFCLDMQKVFGEIFDDDGEELSENAERNFKVLYELMGKEKSKLFIKLIFKDLDGFLEGINQEADLLQGVLSSVGVFTSASAKELDERLNNSDMQMVGVDSLASISLNKGKVDKDVKN